MLKSIPVFQMFLSFIDYIALSTIQVFLLKHYITYSQKVYESYLFNGIREALLESLWKLLHIFIHDFETISLYKNVR